MQSQLVGFKAEDWIGCGKDFGTAPGFVREAFHAQLLIPEPLEAVLLPSSSASIRTLLSAKLPTIHDALGRSSFPELHQFFSHTSPPVPAPLNYLRTFPIPGREKVKSLIDMAGTEWLDGKRSIMYPHIEMNEELFPLWVLTYWQRVHSLQGDLLAWTQADQWLATRLSDSLELGIAANNARKLLLVIPWSSTLSTLPGGVDTYELSTFLSHDWLESSHINLILELIKQRLCDNHPDAQKHYIANVWFSAILCSSFATAPDNKNVPPIPSWIDNIGRKLASGDLQTAAFIFNRHNTHWVSVVVDFLHGQILFGDSMKGDLPPEFLHLFTWWRRLYSPPEPSSWCNWTIAPLLCTEQTGGDTYSCGLLSSNAIEHYYTPEHCSLVPISAVDLERLKILDAVWAVQSMNQMLTTGPTPQRDQTNSSKRPGEPPNLPSVPLKRMKLEESPLELSQISEASVLLPSDDDLVSVSGLSHIVGTTLENHQTASASHKSRAGRPRSSLLDDLTYLVQAAEAGHHARYGCVGCKHEFSGRTTGRVLKHAARCLKLSAELRSRACKASSDNSPGACVEIIKAKVNQKQNTSATVTHSTSDKAVAIANTSERQDWHAYFTDAGKSTLKAALDLAILKFFSCNGIPSHVADSSEWKDIWRIVGRYEPVSRTTMQDIQIPQEAEHVRLKQMQYLKTKHNLTISFDGGGTRRRESFYSCHITTPERESFLIEAFPGNGYAHTAEWISKHVLEVIESIGRTRFAGICSDSTGNTKNCRQRVCNAIPTIINFPDPVHHTALAVKDLCQLDYFRSVVQITRRVIKHHSHSDKATHQLDKARSKFNIRHGLQTIGKTRFATIIHAAVALCGCLPALRYVQAEHGLSIEDCSPQLFMSGKSASLNFERDLNQLISLGSPFAKAIMCLESSHSTAADVYIFWCAIAACLKRVLSDNESGIPSTVKGQIRGIFNARWREMFEHGPNRAHLSAFYLHPGYTGAAIFKEPNAIAFNIKVPARNDKHTGQEIKHRRVYQQVGEYLTTMLASEAEHGKNIKLNVSSNARKLLKDRFQHQFRAFAAGHYPFSTPLRDDQTALKWWKELEHVPQAEILAALAIKLFSIMPNSMPEERTVSNFTWMNSALRNRQHLSTIVSHTQIRQFYRSKARVKTKSIPTVRFCEMDSLLRDMTMERPKDTEKAVKIRALDQDDGEDDTDAVPGESWLDDLTEEVTTDAATEFVMEHDVELTHEELISLLASDRATGVVMQQLQESQHQEPVSEEGASDGVSWVFDADF
ncbi:hypothetical protein CERSUDRAFT_73706 [Gelatoporia subvermispora B]|uniref:Ubiquitin-like protease family profile domain-containing protein n=1 Tax=Ceriporiopsis subvermispora (strain B) TaxID=914234 RepID=M2PND7_CERS8|nr:hypothetical protein CERSUDRAFT_73706 [Gelatoporia subvermispora B]